jgi:hypothetical protein
MAGLWKFPTCRLEEQNTGQYIYVIYVDYSCRSTEDKVDAELIFSLKNFLDTKNQFLLYILFSSGPEAISSPSYDKLIVLTGQLHLKTTKVTPMHQRLPKQNISL